MNHLEGKLSIVLMRSFSITTFRSHNQTFFETKKIQLDSQEDILYTASPPLCSQPVNLPLPPEQVRSRGLQLVSILPTNKYKAIKEIQPENIEHRFQNLKTDRQQRKRQTVHGLSLIICFAVITDQESDREISNRARPVSDFLY